MSFPLIPPEGEHVENISPDDRASGLESPKVPRSILKTTAKSSSTVRSILKKSSEESSLSSKKVGFKSEVQVLHFEKYLKSLGDSEENEEDHEGEENDIDEETMKNTLINQGEGSKVQMNEEFFIPPNSGETRSPKMVSKVYSKLSSLDKREHKVNVNTSSSTSSVEGQDSKGILEVSSISFPSIGESSVNIENARMSSVKETREGTSPGIRIGSVFRRITASIGNIGQRLSDLVGRIVNALSGCWALVRNNTSRQSGDSEPLLVSVIYNANITSSSLETLSA